MSTSPTKPSPLALPAAPRYPFLELDVTPEEADEASALLFELGADGVEERDATTLARAGAAGKVTLVCSFADRAAAEEAAEAVPPAWSPRVTEIVGDAWRDAWKAHFVPFPLTPHVTVRPPWEPYEAKSPDEIVLELEPGRAFGTGLHATTSLLARYLDDHRDTLAKNDCVVLDVGTGSGILALVALALGAARAVAVDVDPDAVDVTRENAERNAMAARIVASATPIEEVSGRYPVVLANIEARVLIPMAAALAARVAEGGTLLLSGILDGQEGEVAGAFSVEKIENALILRATLAEGEWRALVLVRA